MKSCGNNNDDSVIYSSLASSNSSQSQDVSSHLPLRLIYNRVPKCGSTTLYTLMKKLSILNNFTHFNSKIYNRRMLSKEEQV